MIERCFDYRRIRKWPEWRVRISSEVIYLMVVECGKDLGLWTLHPYHDGLMAHANMGDRVRGRAAKKSAYEVLRWVFENTSIEKVYASVSHERKHAKVMVISIGLNPISREADADIYLITKGEYERLE